MADAPDGEQIVGDMAAGREWWRLRAEDVAPWIRRLPVIIRTNKYNRLGRLGRPWDGVSDVPVGEPEHDGESDLDLAEPLVEDLSIWNSTTASGAEVRRLVVELRRLIAQLPTIGVRPPDHGDVRATLAGEEGDASDPTTGMVVIDFDMGEFIVPIGLEDWQLRPDTWTPVERVARMMVEVLVHAAEHRGKLLRRERSMREAFERMIADSGGGAAPLWLRMEPLGFDDALSNIFNRPYVALAVMLDHHLVWAPSGTERVSSPARLRKHYKHFAAEHEHGLPRLVEMRATGSAGWISDVALALIELGGRNPAEVFREERYAALNDDDLAHYGCDGYFGALFFSYGVLTPYFTFREGCYNDGKLTLDGSYPVTIATATPGRKLAQLVDHPAFVAANIIIERAERSDKSLALFHTPRLITVEEAERTWLSRKVCSAPFGG